MPYPEYTSTAPTQRKVVHFPSDENIVRVHHVDRCVCDKEKTTRWYSPREFMEIRNEIDATVLELVQIEENFNYWDSSKYTLRGIEACFSSRYRSQRREMHQTLVRMVLRAQHEYGYSGDEARWRIQKLSKMCSKASRRRAQEVGALDQFAVGLGRPMNPGGPQQKPSPLHKPLGDGPTTKRSSLIAQQA